MYHYNKSFGVTLVALRKELQSVQGDDLNFALSNLKQSIEMFKSPNFILDFQSNLENETL